MEHDSKERILQAAIKIIARKGKHGTTMEEVAHDASINKAMVYYYYSSKDNLYFEVLKFIFSDLFYEAESIVKDDTAKGKNNEEVIGSFIRYMFEKLNGNSNYTRILIDALSNGLDEIPKAVDLIRSTSDLSPMAKLTDVITDGIDKKIFRVIDAQQTTISIAGMIFIYFLSQNIIKIFDVKIDDEKSFIKNRLNSMIDLIMNGILN